MLFFGRSTVFLVDLELVAQMMHPCAVHYERSGREGFYRSTERAGGEEARRIPEVFMFSIALLTQDEAGKTNSSTASISWGPIWKRQENCCQGLIKRIEKVGVLLTLFLSFSRLLALLHSLC